MKPYLLFFTLFHAVSGYAQPDHISIETKASNYQSSFLQHTFTQYQVVSLKSFFGNAGAKLLDLHLPDQKLSFQKKVNRMLRQPLVSVNNLPVAFTEELTYFNSDAKADSRCRFTIGSNFIAGIYIVNDDTCYIEPAYIYDRHAAKDLFIIYKPENIRKSKNLLCGSGAGNDLPALHHADQANRLNTEAEGCRTIDYTVLVDNSCFEYHNRSVDETVTHILAVMNLTEGDYTGSFNEDFTFQPYEIIIVDDPEHKIFEENNSTIAQHLSFTNQTKIAYKPGYDIVYNWFYNGGWNDIIGLAAISAMCNVQNAKATIADGSTLDGMRNLVSHETGHIFGCAHTNGCIMNSSINYTKCWDVFSLNSINAFLAGNADVCLANCNYNPCSDSLPDVKSVIYDSVNNEIIVNTNIKTGETYLVKWGPAKISSARDSLLIVWPNNIVTLKPYCNDFSNIQSVEIQRLCSSDVNVTLKYPTVITQIHPTIKASRGSICVGYDKDTLTAVNVIPGYVLRWRRNGEIISDANDLIFLADLPGVYNFDMANNEFAKCWMTSHPVDILAITPTQHNLTMTYSTSNYLTVDFRNSQYQGKEYELDFGDGSPVEKKLSPQDTIQHVYPKAGTYMPIVYGNACTIVNPDTSVLYLTIDEFVKDSAVYAPSQHMNLDRFDCKYSASFSKDSATAIHHIADEHFGRQYFSAEWVLKIDSGYYNNKVYPETFWLAGNADSIHFHNDLAIRIENDTKRIIFTVTDQNNIQKGYISSFPPDIDFHKWNSLAVKWVGKPDFGSYSYITFSINKRYSNNLSFQTQTNNYADTLKLINDKKPTLSTGKHYAGSNLRVAGFYGTVDAIRVTNLPIQIDLSRDTMNFKPLLSIEKENLICNDSIIKISVSDVFVPVSREWYRNDTLIPGETNNYYLASNEGSYYHIAKDNDGTTCKTDPVDLKAVTILARWGYSRVGLTVYFHAHPLCYSGVKWDFGDGTYSTELNPVKTYSNNGNYNVSLIATNTFYQTADTLMQTVSVAFDQVEDEFINQSTFGTPENISYAVENCNGQIQLRRHAEYNPGLSYVEYDSTLVFETGTVELLVNVKSAYAMEESDTTKASLLYLKSSGEDKSSLTLNVQRDGYVAVRYRDSWGSENGAGFYSDFKYDQWNAVSVSYGNGITLKVNNTAYLLSYYSIFLDSPRAILGGKIISKNGQMTNYHMFEGDVEKIRFSDKENDFTYNTSCILPVQVVSFKADTGCPPTLYWQVANEQDITAYYVEQSVDGRHFYTAGFVPAAAGSSGMKTYQYKPAAGQGVYYYRLKIIGDDRTAKYTNVLSVESNCKTAITIVPNPAFDLINVKGLTNMVNDFSIINEAGRVIQKYKATSATQFNIASLPPGVYILKVNQVETVKFIKMP